MPNLYDVSTDKNGQFIIGGESSADFGFIISEAPTFERATRKFNTFEVPPQRRNFAPAGRVERCYARL